MQSFMQESNVPPSTSGVKNEKGVSKSLSVQYGSTVPLE